MSILKTGIYTNILSDVVLYDDVITSMKANKNDNGGLAIR